MAFLHDHEDGTFWMRFEDDSPEFVLHENNTMLNLFRHDHQQDRFAVEDPSDGRWMVWWRFDQDPELFGQMEDIALAVGSVLVRDTVVAEIADQFNKAHAFTDIDWAVLEADVE